MTLKQIIIERIKSCLSVQTVEMCLYYLNLATILIILRIGGAGDFYTSLAASIFRAMIGNQIEEMWNLMGKPDLFHVVEMGPGMGYLAKDVLGYLQRSAVSSQQSGKRKVFRHLKYTIVELNPSVKANNGIAVRIY